jgi:predicted 3-demethylubiquinone-9 3-methyltransferase (glyoxalase superfamily)
MPKITPFLWFDDKAEEAAEFYAGIFKNARIVNLARYAEGAPRPAGSVMSATFELEGQTFIALNGGPHFSFTPAVSLFVTCQTQDEVDHFWDKLSAGGEVQRCGWLKDKYGLSWQIVPAILGELLQHPDPATARRVMAAMLAMIKLDIAALQHAAAATTS